MELDHVAQLNNTQFIMTCINSVIEYREMNQMVSQREIYIGGGMAKNTD